MSDSISRIAEIIKDYRSGELPISLDEAHVKKWIQQFDGKSQKTILDETALILEKWYFGKEDIDAFLCKVIDFLSDQAHVFAPTLLSMTAFVLPLNRSGKSQAVILQRLKDIVAQKYKVVIKTATEYEIQRYVYIDDGLYTGRKARNEISSLIRTLPQGVNLDVFYLVAGTSGLKYSEKALLEEASQFDIRLNIYRFHLIHNNNHVQQEYEQDGSVLESYEKSNQCLWPEQRMANGHKLIEDYVSSKLQSKPNREKYLFRTHPWTNDSGVFSCVGNRNIVEREFLLKGIEIASRSNCEEKGIYPLGFNLWPSLGFGSFCATYLNISNTCPLVLWWGNLTEHGDLLDCWYPLLPRRVNELDEQSAF